MIPESEIMTPEQLTLRYYQLEANYKGITHRLDITNNSVYKLQDTIAKYDMISGIITGSLVGLGIIWLLESFGKRKKEEVASG